MADLVDLIHMAERGDYRAGFALFAHLRDYLAARTLPPPELADYFAACFSRLDDDAGWTAPPPPLLRTVGDLEAYFADADVSRDRVLEALNLARHRGGQDAPLGFETAKNALLALGVEEEMREPKRAQDRALEDSARAAAKSQSNGDSRIEERIYREILKWGWDPMGIKPSFSVPRMRPLEAAKQRVARERGTSPREVDRAWKAWRNGEVPAGLAEWIREHLIL